MKAFLEALKKLEDEHQVHIGIPGEGLLLFDQGRSAKPATLYQWDEAEQAYSLISLKREGPRILEKILSAIGRNYIELLRAHGDIKGLEEYVDDEERMRAGHVAQRLLEKHVKTILSGMSGKKAPRIHVRRVGLEEGEKDEER